jgi:hypothetical protein
LGRDRSVESILERLELRFTSELDFFELNEVHAFDGGKDGLLLSTSVE